MIAYSRFNPNLRKLQLSNNSSRNSAPTNDHFIFTFMVKIKNIYSVLKNALIICQLTGAAKILARTSAEVNVAEVTPKALTPATDTVNIKLLQHFFVETIRIAENLIKQPTP